MPFAPGAKLGPYEIQAAIGSGGMGDVYRATDTHLKRPVAIKVLPDAVAGDAERLLRFRREAEFLATLNHPHIAAIYGLEQSQGTTALVMELVEGPTLAERLSQGPIPVDESLAIARQIAEAVDAAHQHGIVHRDLKPANIKVRQDGTVKVLDFGLAKTIDPAASSLGLSQSPTITTPAMTGTGVILGTAAYMSPEQAKGKPVDRQADVWGFGAVLFEMLTGRRAFPGNDVADTLASVLRADPDWSLLPADTPAAVRRLLRRCLTRERYLRLRELGSAVIEINDAERGLDLPGERAPDGQKWRWAAFVAAGLALGLVLGGAGMWSAVRRSRPAASPVARFTLATSPREPLLQDLCGQDIAIAPAGDRVAYVAGEPEGAQIMLRTLGDLDPVPLRGTEGGFAPFFSPDGQSIAFAANNALRRVSISGGEPVTLWQTSARLACSSGRWGAGDRIVVSVIEERDGRPSPQLLLLSAGGASPEPITVHDEDWQPRPLLYVAPDFLPDGDTVLLTAMASPFVPSGMAVVSLSTGAVRRLPISGNYGRYVPSGHLVYASGRLLQAIAFDIDRLETTGEPFSLVDGIFRELAMATANFAVSDTGSLVYVAGEQGTASDHTILWMDRLGRAEPVAGFPRGDFRNVRFSPDERMLAVDDGSDIWTFDFERQTLNQVTREPGRDSHPVWTPDGNRLVFSSGREGGIGLFRKSADGTGETERLLQGEGVLNLTAAGFTPDGGRLLVQGIRRLDAERDIGMVSLQGESRIDWILATPANEAWPSVSPDGHWIAYSRRGSNFEFQIYVERFPELSDRRRISTWSGDFPVWSRDGGELFFRASYGNRFWVAPFDPSDGSNVRPEALFDGAFAVNTGNRMYDWAPSRERFAVIAAPSAVAGTSPIVMIQNWPDLLPQ